MDVLRHRAELVGLLQNAARACSGLKTQLATTGDALGAYTADDLTKLNLDADEKADLVARKNKLTAVYVDERC